MALVAETLYGSSWGTDGMGKTDVSILLTTLSLAYGFSRDLAVSDARVSVRRVWASVPEKWQVSITISSSILYAAGWSLPDTIELWTGEDRLAAQRYVDSIYDWQTRKFR